MKLKSIAAVAFLSFAAQAQATIIDFNQVARGTGYTYGNGQPYQEDGFQISNSHDNSYGQLFWGGASFNADPVGNTYSHNYGNTTSTLSKIGGGSFTFNSIDLTDVYNNGSGGNVRFNFFFSNNTTSQSIVSLVNAVGLHTFSFNLADVISVNWTPLTTQGPFLQIDNIVLDGASSNVPEPASLALLGLGLVGLVASRRRKTA